MFVSGKETRMTEIAGEHVDYLAFHHMFDPDSRQQPVLRGELYRRDPDAGYTVRDCVSDLSR